MKQKILIDIEFTGLDNTFINDNEIIQVKLFNLMTNKYVIKNFNSKKKLTAHVQLEHGVKKYKGKKFDRCEFIKLLKSINASTDDIFIGFSISQDKLMLKKYDIVLSNYRDIKDKLMLSKYEYRLATEGNGLAECYFIVTGKIEDFSHKSIDELFIIKELYKKTIYLKLSKCLYYVPFGHCAGMSIDEYCLNYRRAADGYRFNNNDLFSSALDNSIYYIENNFDEYDYGDF